jgi:hypothetical protein
MRARANEPRAWVPHPFYGREMDETLTGIRPPPLEGVGHPPRRSEPWVSGRRAATAPEGGDGATSRWSVNPFTRLRVAIGP